MTGRTRITFGGYQGPGSVHTRGAQVFCDTLRRLAGDRVEVVFRPNIIEEGHKAADLLSLTESGELDGCYFSSSYLAGRVPALSIFDMHFAVPDRAQTFAMLDGALGDRLAQEVAQHTGYAMLGAWDNGLRHISTVDRPLNQPEQCRGLVLRTLANEDHQRIFRALGFDPRVIDVKDLPAAVTRGEVDAQENPLTNIYNFDLHKTQATITLTGHLLGIAPVLFNRTRLQSWPDDIRDAVTRAVAAATDAQRAFAREDDDICAQKLRADGAALIPLNESERQSYRAAVSAEVGQSRARLDPGLLALFETLPPTERQVSA
ncbi:Extracytoplasmic solute receptor protein YiaO [Thalassovita gelatinovora]|uniref:Extracytoplasmic solute receptor protein YiaO n=1 Tax=Thalassovita gelatinovora TaxID=53501 RepID=A0A0N7LW45_THAGE|nr:TRAP transporter substrate-binding protein [Thalassovita gelatinovora]QIZ81616.1 TRAP transporter substrate-binding protein [Thalassovita gelatinovora]CUH68074.1 Extracytoplasmic solute receptor protein YiaO [Thalassovita gelatinovora]SEQ28724.1 TRAP-type C4-dicarboxylate transport system, substrate-binding protein [Thalassovita gelatinovora]